MADDIGALYGVVVPDAGGDSEAEDSGEVCGSVLGDSEDGVTELGVDEEGAVEVGGHDVVAGDAGGDREGVGVPVLALGDEAHGDGEVDDEDEGAVGVVTLTAGEGRAGGWTGLSWWPVSPRCREIHWPLSGS